MAKQHIVIGGGSGLVGRALSQALQARGDRVTIISRTAGEGRLTWEQLKSRGLPPCDAVINLAGKHILDMRRLWGERYRQELLESRVETTRMLVDAIDRAKQKPATFISVAGKCFYGSQAYRRQESYFDLDEYSEPIGVDYPAELVQHWEAAADNIDPSVRHVKLRLGIVLSNRQAFSNLPFEPNTRSPGAFAIFPLLRSVYKKGAVFSMGSGVQPFPWVHIDDVTGIFLRAIDRTAMRGVYNLVAPGIVTNREFTELLATRLGRKVLGSIPAWAIKALVGRQRSTILLLGQRVRPTRTLESGYAFQHSTLESCLDDLVPQTLVEAAV